MQCVYGSWCIDGTDPLRALLLLLTSLRVCHASRVSLLQVSCVLAARMLTPARPACASSCTIREHTLTYADIC